MPAIDILLDWGRIVGEGIQLVERTKAASQGLDGVVDAAGLGLVGEVEGDKGKVSAAKADGVVLSEDGGHGSVDTRGNHGICDPHLFHAALTLGRRFRIGGHIWTMLEDQVVSGYVKGPCDLGGPLVQRHIVNLVEAPSVDDLSCWTEEVETHL